MNARVVGVTRIDVQPSTHFVERGDGVQASAGSMVAVTVDVLVQAVPGSPGGSAAALVERLLTTDPPPNVTIDPPPLITT